MRTLRSRFILSHILPILLVVPLVGAALIYILETQVLLRNLADNLNKQAGLVAHATLDEPGIWTDRLLADAFVNNVSLYLEEHVALLDNSGRLLVSSAPELNTAADFEGLAVARAGEVSIVVNYGFFQQRGEALVPVKDSAQQLVGIVAVTETLEGAASVFGRLRRIILLALAIELALGVFVGLLLARRLEHPIVAAIGTLEDIARGKRTEPIPETGPEELRRLAWSVNTLSARLRSLEEARRRLLANLVHELGRPLGAIRSALHTARNVVDDNPVVRDELLAGVEEEVKRMQPLLEDLAQLHGQVLGTVTLVREPVTLSEWLPTVLLPWRAAAREKDIQWRTAISEDLPVLTLDASRMGQAVGNLLSNAVKYTPAGGTVTVTAAADQDQVWIAVADSGPGVIPEEQEQIFEPFFRSQRERRFPQGLGLGLTIARDLVEAHGGSLEVSSEPGHGSWFTVRLPRD